jgi:hypothetical protein
MPSSVHSTLIVMQKSDEIVCKNVKITGKEREREREIERDGKRDRPKERERNRK